MATSSPKKTLTVLVAGIAMTLPSVASAGTIQHNQAGLTSVGEVKIDISPVGRLSSYTSRTRYTACTGTVVDENVIVTAKHCINSKSPSVYFTLGIYVNPYRYTHKFRVIGRFGDPDRDLAFFALAKLGDGRSAGDVVRPAKLSFNMPIASLPTADTLPDLTTIMGYTDKDHHKDGNGFDLEKCGDMQLDRVRSKANIIYDRSGHMLHGQVRLLGNCWDYKSAKNSDGAATQEKVAGSVINHGASGGPMFALSKDGAPYVLAVNRSVEATESSSIWGSLIAKNSLGTFNRAKSAGDAAPASGNCNFQDGYKGDGGYRALLVREAKCSPDGTAPRKASFSSLWVSRNGGMARQALNTFPEDQSSNLNWISGSRTDGGTNFFYAQVAGTSDSYRQLDFYLAKGSCLNLRVSVSSERDGPSLSSHHFTTVLKHAYDDGRQWMTLRDSSNIVPGQWLRIACTTIGTSMILGDLTLTQSGTWGVSK